MADVFESIFDAELDRLQVWVLDERIPDGFGDWLRDGEHAEKYWASEEAFKSIWEAGDTSTEKVRAFKKALSEHFAFYRTLAHEFRALRSGRELLPSFVGRTSGYSYLGEIFDLTATKLEAWVKSSAGYGAHLPYPEFWTWFKAHRVYAKFVKLESRLEELYTKGDDGARAEFESLQSAWSDSIKWAVGEFAAMAAQPPLV